MAGYRDTSSYEPFALPQHGRPMRPYNWVQWAGVAIVVIGLALDLLYFVRHVDWMKAIAPSLAVPIILIGISLINSRRQEVVDPAPELAAARKRWLIITVAVCTVILGVAAIIDFKGA